MFFSMGLMAVLETVDEDVKDMLKKLRQEAADNKGTDEQRTDGGVLAQPASSEELLKRKPELIKAAFKKLWNSNVSWAKLALEDGVAFARTHEPRDQDVIEKALRPSQWRPKQDDSAEIEKQFSVAWQSLQNRGWKSQPQNSGPNNGKTRYEYEGKQVSQHQTFLVVKCLIVQFTTFYSLCFDLRAVLVVRICP